MIWDKAKKIITENKRFIITTHVNSDGDGLGAELALYYYLKNLGKEVTIINPTPVPNNLHFLFPEDECEVFDEEKHTELFEKAEYLIVLDVCVWKRIGNLAQITQRLNLPILCIDHHPYTESLSREMVIIDSASSTGELLYDFLKSSNATISYPIALGIYISLVNDTGNFRFSNATDKVHMIAAEMLQFGIYPDEIYSKLYEFHTANKIKFIGSVLSNLDYRLDGEITIITVTRELMDKFALEDWETEGLIDYPRAIQCCRVAILACERKNGELKFSLRAKDKRANLTVVSNIFGGGGHKYASGISLTEGKMEDILPKVVDEVEKQLIDIDNNKMVQTDDSVNNYFETITELCKEVIKTEYQAAHFYLLLMGKAKINDNGAKEIIAALYKTENEHLGLFEGIFNQLLNWDKTRFDIQEYIKKQLPDFTSLSKYPELEEMFKKGDTKGIIDVAKGFEEKTITRYRKLISEYDDFSKNHNYLNGLISMIIEEEEKHIKELSLIH
ncbi:MAG: DHH family phosphoesterase [Nitrospinae bacterium]|nr:DHH family phosphoesterase [Nitrospinota bacterium]